MSRKIINPFQVNSYHHNASPSLLFYGEDRFVLYQRLKPNHRNCTSQSNINNLVEKHILAKYQNQLTNLQCAQLQQTQNLMDLPAVGVEYNKTQNSFWHKIKKQNEESLAVSKFQRHQRIDNTFKKQQARRMADNEYGMVAIKNQRKLIREQLVKVKSKIKQINQNTIYVSQCKSVSKLYKQNRTQNFNNLNKQQNYQLKTPTKPKRQKQFVSQFSFKLLSSLIDQS